MLFISLYEEFRIYFILAVNLALRFIYHAILSLLDEE